MSFKAPKQPTMTTPPPPPNTPTSADVSLIEKAARAPSLSSGGLGSSISQGLTRKGTTSKTSLIGGL